MKQKHCFVLAQLLHRHLEYSICRSSMSQGRTRASVSPGHSHLQQSEGSRADPGLHSQLATCEPRAEHKMLDSALRAEFRKPAAALLDGECLC